MKGWVCQVCGHVEFRENPPDFCPVCHAPKEKFRFDEKAVQVTGNLGLLTDLEKKHVPVIRIDRNCGSSAGGCVEVCVSVGEVLHVMEEKHFIGFIDFYLDDQHLARTSMTPGKINPGACVYLKAAGKSIKAVEWCNVHGRWQAETPLN